MRTGEFFEVWEYELKKKPGIFVTSARGLVKMYILVDSQRRAVFIVIYSSVRIIGVFVSTLNGNR